MPIKRSRKFPPACVVALHDLVESHVDVSIRADLEARILKHGESDDVVDLIARHQKDGLVGVGFYAELKYLVRTGMSKRNFEDRVNAGYYTTRDHGDFIRDAKFWLRERVPPNVASKVFELAVPDPTVTKLEMLDSLKKFVELFDPVKVVLAIDDRDDRLYYASCPQVQPEGSKPETGWSFEEALGLLIMRMPGRFGFLIEKKGRTSLEART